MLTSRRYEADALSEDLPAAGGRLLRRGGGGGCAGFVCVRVFAHGVSRVGEVFEDADFEKGNSKIEGSREV